MSHYHNVLDSDSHFIIDPVSRTISTTSAKLYLCYKDHNSERYTFELPRYIEAHDMSLCNLVEIHFNNVSKDKQSTYADVYVVNDFADVNDNTVEFSWLISRAATSLVGRLSFSISFKCVAEDGMIEYEWSTTIFESIAILKRNDNIQAVSKEYSDLVSQLAAAQMEIQKLKSSLVTSYNDLTDKPSIRVSHHSDAVTIEGSKLFTDYGTTAFITVSYWTDLKSGILTNYNLIVWSGQGNSNSGVSDNDVTLAAPALIIPGRISYGRQDVIIFDGRGHVWDGDYKLSNEDWGNLALVNG